MPSQATGFHTIPWDAPYIDDVGGYNGAGGYILDRDGLWQSYLYCSRNSIAAAAQPQVRWKLNGVGIGTRRALNRVEGQGVGGLVLFDGLAGDLLTAEVTFSGTVAVNLNDDAVWTVLRIGPKSWDF